VTQLDAPPQGVIGTAVRRREDRRLLTGTGLFLDDIPLPGALEAAFLRSSHAAARIRGIEVSAAAALPGVFGVYTGRDLMPIQKAIPPKVTHPQLHDIPRYPMPYEKVHFVGEPIAVVLATSRHIAEDALELIDVDYEVLPAVSSVEAAVRPDAPLVHEGAEDNISVHAVQKAGDPDSALATAPHRLSERFTVTRGGGHSMETRGVAARFEEATGELTVWDTTQSPHYARNMLSYLFDLPEDRIRLIAPTDVGGGFGPKAQFYGEEAVIAWLALQTERTVKWVEDRQENFVSAMMERGQVHDVEIGFDDEGHILAIKNVFKHDQGAYCAGLQVPMITLSTLPGQYRIPNIHTELFGCYTNMVPTSSVRGAGRPQAVHTMERMIDRMADHLGLDPAEVRRRNLIGADEFPYPVGLTFRDGSALTYDSGNFQALLEGVLERIRYDEVRAEQAALRERGVHRGVGLAVYIEGCGLGPYEGATIRLTNSGTFLVTLAAAGQGQGYETVYAQIAADAVGTGFEQIRVRTGDTSKISFGQGTFASRITATAGPAVLEAGQEMRAKLLAVAAVLLDVDAADLAVTESGVQVVKEAERGVTFLEIAQVANVGKHGITLPRGIPPGLECTAYFAPAQAAYASGAHAAVVDVDPETGETTIVDYVIGHDCGNVINPLLVDGQVLGGFAHGIGNALLEEPFYDENGQPQTTSYLDYALPSSVEVPPVQLFHVHTPSPLNPLGVKGAGEGGTIPVPATIANAVEDALRPFGARINDVPVTPPKVVEALERAAAARHAEATGAQTSQEKR
jgi:carbon-monoxide dehydrogenase large subunit